MKNFNDQSVKSINKPTITKPEEVLVDLSSDYNLKSSSTVTTSDIIPIYEYSLKPASSTYMMNDLSTYCTSSLGNIPESVLLRTEQDPLANLTDDYTTDNYTEHTSEYEVSSMKSSNRRCSKSSMQVHVSSATTLLNKTDVSLNGFVDSADILHQQINSAAENIKKTLYEIEASKYKKNSLPYSSNREKANLPSTSKMISPLNKKDDVNLRLIKSASQTSEISSGSITPQQAKLKGATQLELMEMLTKVTMQSYHSQQELNNTLEVAVIDEHIKMNQSIHESSLYSDYTNSDQFSNITGHGVEHLGEDEIYSKGSIAIGHKNLKEKRYESSPNGSMVAVLDFEVHDWNDGFDSVTPGTSKD